MRLLLILALLHACDSAADVMWKDCLGGKCFKVMGPESSFFNLKLICERYGGKLFSASSIEEMNHIQNIFKREVGETRGASLFVGARMNDERRVVFEDGTSPNQNFIQNILIRSRGQSKANNCVRSSTHFETDALYWVQSLCNHEQSYSLCYHETPEHGFCYEVRWEDNFNRTRKRVLNPVTKFPLHHPALERNVCGGQEYGYIPPNGLWSMSGATNVDANSCQSVSGGELFYAYGYPIPSSSNTGFSDDDSLAMFFVLDTDYRGYWVLTIDRPDGIDENDGYLDLQISSEGTKSSNVEIKLHDDPAIADTGDECRENDVEGKTYNRDCYAWDSGTASGNFIWRWHPCCTDGMVLGKLPSKDFCIDVKTKYRSGLSKMLIGDFSNDRDDIEMSEIPFQSFVNVCGYECPAFCSEIKSCGQCSNTEGCGWCPGYGCEPLGAKGGCPGGWHDSTSESCCEECNVANDCLTCTTIEGCGWETHSSSCKAGNKFSRALCLTSSDLEPGFAFEEWECRTPSPTQNVTAKSVETLNPTTSLTLAPTTDPNSAFNNNSNSNHTFPQNEGGKLELILPLTLIPFMVLLIFIGFLVSRNRQRKHRSSLEEVLSPGAALAVGHTEFEDTNPMHEFEQLALPQPKFPNNTLIAALHKLRDDVRTFRLYSNNPGVAMQLSEHTSCFVKCTEDDGDLIDKLEGGIFTKVSTLAQKLRRHKPTRVKTHLKVKKRDEWTAHLDPSSRKIFYYNGKHNRIATNATGVSIAMEKDAEPSPLRWEFAPDEFDDFDKVVHLLSMDNWQRHDDSDFFQNPISSEIIWIES